MAGNFGLGGSGAAATKRDKRQPVRTEGGYLIGDRTAGGTSETGY